MSPRIRPAPALVSIVLQPLPLAPLQLLLSAAVDIVARRHPGMFERLGEHALKRFAIEFTDLPLALLLEPCPKPPRLLVLRRVPATGFDVRISGPFAALTALAEGVLDGDALFFSRDIAIEGDIAAAVALRNALDDSSVDLATTVADCFGPFAPAFKAIAAQARAILNPLIGIRTWS